MRGKRVLDRALTLLLVLFFIFHLFHGLSYAGVDASRPYFTDVGQFNYAAFLLKEGDFIGAAREYGRLIEEFPGSPFKEESQFRMSEAFFKAGLYSEAGENLRLFISNFRESPLKTEAERLLKDASKMETERVPISPQERGAVRYAPGGLHSEGIRAVQVPLLEGRSYAEIEEELGRLAGSGINTVILRVFHNEGDRFHAAAIRQKDSAMKSGVYFKTSRAPVLEDVLSPVVKAAHKKGIAVFAWMTTRYADYGITGREDLLCSSYDIRTRKPSMCRGLDLFNEEALRRIEGLYADLASYPIDGILFQDDLVLRHNEGFGPKAAALFRIETGLTLDPAAMYSIDTEDGTVHYTPLFWRWATWKNRKLLDVAVRLREKAREKNPGIKFAINLMYESVTNPPYALAWLSQSLSESVKRGFDFYSVMAYQRQMEEELHKDPSEVRGMIGELANGAMEAVGEPGKVLIKLQTVDFVTGEPLSNDMVAGLIRDLRSIRGVGIALMPLRPGLPLREMGEKETGGAGGVAAAGGAGVALKR